MRSAIESRENALCAIGDLTFFASGASGRRPSKRQQARSSHDQTTSPGKSPQAPARAYARTKRTRSASSPRRCRCAPPGTSNRQCSPTASPAQDARGSHPGRALPARLPQGHVGQAERCAQGGLGREAPPAPPRPPTRPNAHRTDDPCRRAAGGDSDGSRHGSARTAPQPDRQHRPPAARQQSHCARRANGCPSSGASAARKGTARRCAHADSSPLVASGCARPIQQRWPTHPQVGCERSGSGMLHHPGLDGSIRSVLNQLLLLHFALTVRPSSPSCSLGPLPLYARSAR